MAGLGDLFGRNGVLEQLFLWGLMSEVLRAEFGPFFTALAQDINSEHPLTALPPELAADLVARELITEGDGKAEAARSGIDAGRFASMLERARVRIAPADAAEAVLRSYLTQSDAEAQVKPQGVTPELFSVLVNLAGDAIGPQDAARALLRGYIKEDGTGAGSTSFEQAIAESRLHNKWAPVVRQLAQALLSPPDAASAVVRNFMARGDAEKLAQEQGVDASTFEVMTHLAADAPGPQQLAEALRRGLIPAEGSGPDSTSFTQGIAEGRLADKWAPVIKGLAQLWPTPVDAIDAAVKGQIPAGDAEALFEKLGGDPQFYSWLLSSAGEGPTPLQAAEMAGRGIIPWDGAGPEVTSFEQAVKESHYRDKWTDAYKALSHPLLPPGTVVTLLSHQLLTHDQAAKLLAEQNMDADAIAVMLQEAEYTQISQYRGLTQTAVVDMYYGHQIDKDKALQLLGLLHVTDQAAQLLLGYADLRQVIDSIQRSVQRIAQLYTGRKISTQTAKNALTTLGIPVASVEEILKTWELQAQASVTTLTGPQIVAAWYYKALTTDEAMEELQAIGYTEFDAWALLSTKAKGPLPGKPVRKVAEPPGAVIPGTT